MEWIDTGMAGIAAMPTPDLCRQFRIPMSQPVSLLGVLEDGTAVVASKADAHLIVTAVNNHQALLDIVEEFLADQGTLKAQFRNAAIEERAEALLQKINKNVDHIELISSDA